MASLDSLPPDQRAVLQLVLQKGRSYGEIAQLLSIDSGAVRERALAALAALGPSTPVLALERRAEISDYLLGQLPSAVAERARARISESASERAWARVVASELAPLASGPLPEIPLEAVTPAPEPTEPAAQPTEPEPIAPAAPYAAATPVEVAQATGLGPEQPPAPRSSRTGGAILLGAGALVAIIVIAVVIVLVVNSSKSSSSHQTTTTTRASATTSTSSTAAATPIAQVILGSPTHDKKISGIAEVIRQGTKTGIVIVAQGVPANTTHDAYAVWLYNSQSDNVRLGFVNPGVKTNGKLQTAGVLPANAAHFHEVLVTLETQAKPSGPGKVVLEGPLNITQ